MQADMTLIYLILIVAGFTVFACLCQEDDL